MAAIPLVDMPKLNRAYQLHFVQARIYAPNSASSRLFNPGSRLTILLAKHRVCRNYSTVTMNKQIF